MTDQIQDTTNLPGNPVDASNSGTAPTLDPSSESPSEGTTEGEKLPDAETTKDVRVARALAMATKKERKAAERERQAEAKVRQADERAKQAETARDEFTSLLSDAAKNPDKAMTLLKKAGIPSLDALARLVLQLAPEPESTDKVALRAEQEIRELRAQIQKEKDDAAMSTQQAEFNRIYNVHLNKVQAVLTASPDDYALTLDNNGQTEVLRRVYAFAKEHNIQEISPEDELLMLKHFASEVEAELEPQAKSFFEKLSKVKKLGINTNVNAGNAIAANQDPNSESLDSAALKAVAQKKSSKFITNESTVSSKPLPKTYNLGRKDEDAIQQALRAMEGK